MAAWDNHIIAACGLKVKPQMACASLKPSFPACAPAQDTFQLDISETRGSTNQKSFIKTVLNEKLTFAQRNS